MVVLGGWAVSYERGNPVAFRVSGFGFRVSGFGCVEVNSPGRTPNTVEQTIQVRGSPELRRVSVLISVSGLGFGIRISGFGFTVSGFGFKIDAFGFRVSGFGFRVSGLEFRFSGFEFRFSG